MQDAEVSYPKVLVLSHNCFSKTGSNGRTLGHFFVNWPKDSIAQFYIIDDLPDAELCTNYFKMTDVEILKSYYRKGAVGSRVDLQQVRSGQEIKEGHHHKFYTWLRKRTPFHYVARNLIWDKSKPKYVKLNAWLDEFNPSVVFLQLGDYAFMIRIAMEIARKRNIPLMIYTCEDYYFKDRKSLSPLFHYYRADYKKQVRKLYDFASYTIYNSEMLQDTYRGEFAHQSKVVMTSTNITSRKEKKANLPLAVSYLGNLDVGRHEPLIEVAEAMHDLDTELYLDVYGKVRDLAVKKALLECPGIRYKGFVSYEEVIRVMQNSDILVHAENFSPYYQWYLKHAFSTKIADCLGSGTCLLVYAPENMAFTRYLSENQAAFVIMDKARLKDSLQRLLTDPQLRQSIERNALGVSHRNHDGNANAINMREIINQVVGIR